MMGLRANKKTPTKRVQPQPAPRPPSPVVEPPVVVEEPQLRPPSKQSIRSRPKSTQSKRPPSATPSSKSNKDADSDDLWNQHRSKSIRVVRKRIKEMRTALIRKHNQAMMDSDRRIGKLTDQGVESLDVAESKCEDLSRLVADARLEDEEHLAAVYQGKMEKSVDNAIDGIDMETIFTEEEMSKLGYDKHPDDVAAEEEPEQPPMVEDREHPDYHRLKYSGGKIPMIPVHPGPVVQQAPPPSGPPPYAQNMYPPPQYSQAPQAAYHAPPPVQTYGTAGYQAYIPPPP